MNASWLNLAIETVTETKIKTKEANETTSFLEEKNCPLCGAEKAKTVYHWPACFYPHDKFETASWDGRCEIDLKIVQCFECQLPYTRPSFREQSLHLVYPDEIVPENVSRNKVVETKKFALLRSLASKYLKKGAKVCDIGARYGSLVFQLNSDGFDSLGVEMNRAACDLASEFGIDDVHCCSVSDLPQLCDELNIDQVDCFVMDDVLEHLVHPSETFKKLESLQTSGGMIITRQMDWSSFGHRYFGRNWYYLQPAAHMTFWNKRTITSLFEKHGYDVTEVNRTSTKQILKKLWRHIRRRIKSNKTEHFEWWVNGKQMYLANRWKFNDMFTVVAKKR